jgi:8-oxo-dGTP diphosphatase
MSDLGWNPEPKDDEPTKYTYDYPMPANVVDLVVTADYGGRLLLIERGGEPWKGKWALPGGYVEIDELIEDAARRELNEETNLNVSNLRFLQYYDDPKRDPRGRVVSFAFAVDCGGLTPDVKAGSDAKNIQWITYEEYCRLIITNQLAADHEKIVFDAIGWGSKIIETYYNQFIQQSQAGTKDVNPQWSRPSSCTPESTW